MTTWTISTSEPVVTCMKYRYGLTEELPNGKWIKTDLELEEPDILSACADAKVNYERLSVTQKFQFARCLCEVLLYTKIVEEYPHSQGRLDEAMGRFQAVKTKLSEA